MIKGSDWWADRVPDKLGEHYTQEVVAAVRSGDAVIEWATIVDGDFEFEIMRAPLAVGTFDDHVFALGLTAEAVDLIALALEERGVPVMSPTPHLWDLAAEDPRQVQIGPHTLPQLIGRQNGAAGMTKTAAKASGDAIMADRPALCALISAACKCTVLHPYGDADGIRDDHACEYGWRLPGKVGWGSANSSGTGWVVQSAQWAHFYRHFFDYSMGAVYVKARARLAGRSVDLRKLARGGPDSARVAPAGPVPFIVHPECRDAVSGVLEQIPDTQPSERPIIAIGSKGSAVASWQRILMRAGFSLAPWNDDGVFGKLTHNATVGFQKERGLPGNGIVDDATWQAEHVEPAERDEPDGGISAVTLCRNFTQADRKSVDNIVIHTIEAVEASTTADNTAAWGAGPSAPRASWHYALDDDSTILCVPEESVAWAAPGLNKRGIQLEHAGFARQSYDEWFDPFSRRMLARSAKLAAVICKRWNIPVRFVDAAGLMRGERGITTHYQVTKGPGKGRTTHTDPGRGFPMSAYLGMIQEAMT